MNILIYGGGAVGLGIAASVLKAGHAVDILARAETVRLLKQHGLTRTGIFGQYSATADTFGAVTCTSELKGKAFDYILVCAKAFDSQTAAADLAAHPDLLREHGRVVLFQNGWGSAETVTAFLPRDRIYNARVITGFIRPQKHCVEITVHAEAIHIGSLFSDDTAPIQPLCQAIAAGDLPCEAVVDIARDLWAKMLYNCALNPLSAICGVPYGKLDESDHSKHVMNAVVREIFQVMRAAQYRTYWDSPEAYLDVFYGRLIPATARHESSMLQDLRAGKRTEIDAFNGAIVQLGQQHQVGVSVNAMLYQIIKFMEHAE
jgi:2-dehydropantoate 2-reductase